MRPILLLTAAAALVGCGSPSAPPMETAADSLAFKITEGSGGLAAFEALPGLAFEWAVVRDSAELVRTRHVWDKAGDRVRSEWPSGADSVFVAVFSPSGFDPAAPSGRAALNGAELAGAAADSALVDGHARFVNDGYWLLAPLKVFDPGVRRSVDVESGFPRLAIAFDGVGLTPGDRYWIEADDVSGAVMGWSYELESGTEGAWDWVEPVELATPAGPLVLARMKVARDGGAVILTEPTALAEVDEAEFVDLTPRLRAR